MYITVFMDLNKKCLIQKPFSKETCERANTFIQILSINLSFKLVKYSKL